MKNRDLTALFVLAVSAQKKILRSIWTDLGQIHMNIFAAGRNCTEEQSATLPNKTSDVSARAVGALFDNKEEALSLHLQY